MLIQQTSKITQQCRLVMLTIVVFFTLTCSYANTDTSQYLVGKALITALRQGGFNIYIRHEATIWSQIDNVQKADDWLSCNGDEIRQLSEVGRNNAIAIGQSIKSLSIPVGKVMASPYCRTVETARLMQLGSVETTTAVINMRIADYFDGRDAVTQTARALLATEPGAGTNHLIVAHGNVALAVTQIHPAEGEAMVFRPDLKGGFQIVGRLTLTDWVQLSSDLDQ